MSLQAAYDQARTYLETSRVEQAIGVAEHILVTFPDNVEAHRILGEAYLASRQFDQAEAAFSRVLRSDPENIPAHVGLGITYERQSKLDAAVAEFEQALEIRPDMLELRTQLLRLYTDAWGAENATLRLSRPGLARLYAKGHMLPQAIQEFRSVLEEEPDRFDVWVGLAESLWRDGQTDLAAQTCKEILDESPDVLKANLLLGYIHYQAGDMQSSAAYWQRAQHLDPYHSIARALFDPLPDLPPAQLDLPAWDEATWQERRAQEEAARRAAAAPVVVATAAAAATTTDDDFFNASWLDTPPAADAPSAFTGTPASYGPADDDFLASLLNIDDDESFNLSGGVDLDSSSGVTPFSFDEASPQAPVWGGSALPTFDETPDAAEAAVPFTLDELGLTAEPPAAQPAAEPELAAFSFEELGLSAEEIAALNAMGSEVEPPAAQPAAEPELAAFSFEELGLSPDEIAALNAMGSEVEPPAAQPAAEPELAAFSFEELGLSAEEIAALNAMSSEVEPPAAPAAEPELAAFSFEELGLSAEEIAALNAMSSEVDLPAEPAEPELAPFSFEELGLSAEEIAALNEMNSAAETPAAEFDAFADIDLGLGTTEPDSAEAVDPALTPFSFDDLGLSADEIAELDDLNAFDPGAVDPAPTAEVDAEPFSLDELSLSIDDAFDAQPSAAAPAPPAPEFDFERGMGMDDVEPFSLDDLDLSLVGDDHDFGSGSLPPSLQPFSLDDAVVSAGAPLPPLPPFDGDEHDPNGGYSWQQPSAKKNTDFLKSGAAAEPAGPSIFSKLRQRAADLPREEEPPLPPVSADDAEVAHFFSNDPGNVSLRDDDASQPERLTGAFRLPRESDGELGSLAPSGAIGAAAGALAGATAIGAAAQRKEDPPAPPEPPAAPTADAEPELTPFSFEELGLSPDEIALLSGGEPAAPAPEPAADAEPELTPFSFEELGLSPEEIAMLSGGEPAAPAPEPATDAEPELTPFSFEELGLSPDEIAMLSGGEPAAPAPEPATDAEPELTPFSFEELGLSPDEIAMLSGGEPAAPAPEPAADAEPELTPFSFEELGLSPEEIAMLSGGEPAAPAPEPEPEPFNFDTFGLDDDLSAINSAATGETIVPGWSATESPGLVPFGADAADLGTGDAEPFNFSAFEFEDPAAAEAAAVDESFDSDVQPFSLDDLGLGEDDLGDLGSMNRELGLSEEELASLDLGELETFIGDAPTSSESSDAVQQVDTGDPALDRLIMLGQRQGYVDLTDIISVVDDPEEEAERIEEIGWTLHRAGIQIRDGDEIIDMDDAEGADYQELEGSDIEEFASPTSAPPPAPEPVALEGEADLTPFSLEELGLSPEEIAALGLSEALPEPEPVAPAPEPVAPAPPATDTEPDLAPFSLAELGLTPEEIAMLGLSEAAPEPVAPPTPEPVAPPPPAPPAADAEPDLAPFSLAELGLSPEEIAMLGLSEATPEPAAPPAAEPEMKPFSLEELGLSPEEIAALSATEADDLSDLDAETADGDDPFGFEVLETQAVEKVTRRTAPREEEPPPPVNPADLAFVPEPLEKLDNIWDIPEDPAEKTEIARVVLPPMSERPKARPAQPAVASSSGGVDRTRDDARYARREAVIAERSVLRKAGARTPADFIPSGDDALDDFLRQMTAEPTNYPLALSVGRLCAQTGRTDIMTLAYKRPIRDAASLDQIEADMDELIETITDEPTLRQLHRVLGDVYSKQGRFREAMQAYSQTYGRKEAD
jgi:tetratricopeptide (TPR) repeat protein